MTNDGEYFVTCLFTIFVKSLILTAFFLLINKSCSDSLCIMHISPVHIISLCGLLVHFLSNVFGEQKFVLRKS